MVESVPTRLRKLKDRSRLTLEEIAIGAGYARASSLQRYFDEDEYEAGEHLNLKTARKLAKALVGQGKPPITEVEILALAGLGDMRLVSSIQSKTDRRSHFALTPDFTVSMRPVPVVGYVQAGVWLSTIELAPIDRFDIPLPIQAGFDGFVVQGLIVRGASMDLLYPHGSILAVVKFMDLGRDPRNGERVVVLRHKHGESEATVKEYRIGSDGVKRLWPRSTHPDFQQPVPVAPPADEAEELQVAYLVIGSYRPEV